LKILRFTDILVYPLLKKNTTAMQNHIAIYHHASDCPMKNITHVHTGKYEISYCLEGEKNYTLADKNFKLKKHMAILIPKGVEHSYSTPANSDICSLEFSGDFIGHSVIEELCPAGLLDIFFRNTIFDFSDDIYYRIQIEEIIKKCIFEYRENALALYTIRSLVILLLVLLSSFLDKKRHFPKTENSIMKIVNYLNENYFADISLYDVCRKFSLDYKSTSKLFKKTTGISFIDYLNSIRINKCKDLLLNTPQSIISICFQTGYNDLSYFYRIFKKITGSTPADFKKKSISQRQGKTPVTELKL